MKAPDKIYIWEHNIEAGNIQDLNELVVEGSTEYIRKDALLEWAKEEQELTISLREDAWWDEVINKLKSM